MKNIVYNFLIEGAKTLVISFSNDERSLTLTPHELYEFHGAMNDNIEHILIEDKTYGEFADVWLKGLFRELGKLERGPKSIELQFDTINIRNAIEFDNLPERFWQRIEHFGLFIESQKDESALIHMVQFITQKIIPFDDLKSISFSCTFAETIRDNMLTRVNQSVRSFLRGIAAKQVNCLESFQFDRNEMSLVEMKYIRLICQKSLKLKNIRIKNLVLNSPAVIMELVEGIKTRADTLTHLTIEGFEKGNLLRTEDYISCMKDSLFSCITNSLKGLVNLIIYLSSEIDNTTSLVRTSNIPSHCLSEFLNGQFMRELCELRSLTSIFILVPGCESIHSKCSLLERANSFFVFFESNLKILDVIAKEARQVVQLSYHILNGRAFGEAVPRDRLLCELSRKFLEYPLENMKGFKCTCPSCRGTLNLRFNHFFFHPEKINHFEPERLLIYDGDLSGHSIITEDDIQNLPNTNPSFHRACVQVKRDIQLSNQLIDNINMLLNENSFLASYLY